MKNEKYILKESEDFTMKQKVFVGRTIIEDGKEKGFIEIIKTKTGNRYIVLRDEENMISYRFHMSVLCVFANSFLQKKSKLMRKSPVSKI